MAGAAIKGQGKAFLEYLKSLGKQKTTGTGAINSVKTNVPVTKVEKAERDLNLAKHKYKGTAKKTEMTVDKINAQTKRLNEQSKKIFSK